MKIRNLASFGKIWPHFIHYLAPSMPWRLATLWYVNVKYSIFIVEVNTFQSRFCIICCIWWLPKYVFEIFVFTINAQFLFKKLSCCRLRDYSENGADDRNENKCDIETAMLNRVLLQSYGGQSMGNGARNALTSGERINTQLQNAKHNPNYIMLFSHGTIPFQTTRYTRFVIFIVIIYLTQRDPITETIYALAIAWIYIRCCFQAVFRKI